MRRNERRRYVCHHEAGHALVRWYFGHRTDLAWLLTVAELRATGGRVGADPRSGPDKAEGMVEGGYNISDAISAAAYRSLCEQEQSVLNAHAIRSLICGRDVMLILLSAGLCAEAAYRHWSPAACALDGGAIDLKHTREVVDAWFADPNERRAAVLLADARATALVRSKQGAYAIKLMAEALMRAGEIAGEEIVQLCGEAYGGRQPAYGSWVPHWPPSLADLRNGVIHEWQPI